MRQLVKKCHIGTFTFKGRKLTNSSKFPSKQELL